MDPADFADIDQGARVDAAIETSRNLAAAVDAAIYGSGYCLECEKSVDPVQAKFKINGEWVVKSIYPRWCCPECQIFWERDQ